MRPRAASPLCRPSVSPLWADERTRRGKGSEVPVGQVLGEGRGAARHAGGASGKGAGVCSFTGEVGDGYRGQHWAQGTSSGSLLLPLWSTAGWYQPPPGARGKCRICGRVPDLLARNLRFSKRPGALRAHWGAQSAAPVETAWDHVSCATSLLGCPADVPVPPAQNPYCALAFCCSESFQQPREAGSGFISHFAGGETEAQRGSPRALGLTAGNGHSQDCLTFCWVCDSLGWSPSACFRLPEPHSAPHCPAPLPPHHDGL